MKILPVILLIAGLAFGYLGYRQFQDSGSSVSIGDLELSASDEGGRTQAYMLLGLGVVCLVVGGVMMRGSKT